jgi:ABC-type branched-subunit amino acid transport system substrate-binding protein
LQEDDHACPPQCANPILARRTRHRFPPVRIATAQTTPCGSSFVAGVVIPVDRFEPTSLSSTTLAYFKNMSSRYCLPRSATNSRGFIQMHFSSLRHVFSFILTASVISAPLHAQGDRVVKIGLIEDASGRLGEMGKKGIEQFTDSFKTINAGGGIAIAGSRYSLQLIVFDAESRIDKANQGVARLVAEDKVDILISAYPITQDAARNTNAPILVLAPIRSQALETDASSARPYQTRLFVRKGGWPF